MSLISFDPVQGCVDFGEVYDMTQHSVLSQHAPVGPIKAKTELS